MLITREVDYALRILLALSDTTQKTTKDLCDREFIPQQFAYKIIKKLSLAGLISVGRGVNGGCKLAIDLKEKTLLDVMIAMESEPMVNACMKNGYKCDRKDKSGCCTIHVQLEDIQNSIENKLSQYTLNSVLLGQ